MDILSRRYRKNPDMVYRKIVDEFVLVPIRHDVADMEAIYTLDEVGARIWELIDEEHAGHDILEIIQREYDVTPEVAQADLVEFLEELEAVKGIASVEG